MVWASRSRWLLLGVALLAVMFSACATSTRSPSSAADSRAQVVLRVTTPTATAAIHQGAPLPASPPIHAAAAFLINPDTGAVYLASNADTPLAMASTTKIMTAIVALSVGRLDMPITVQKDAIGLADGQASTAGLEAGETLTLHDMLYALLLPSGDDAAVAIADSVAGSQEQFVALMNAESALLGLWHTHYNDVHGLDATDHYTTARDLARLTSFAMRSPTFSRIVATAEYAVPPTDEHHQHKWITTNELLTDYVYPGVTGVKTGFTGTAGHCLVFTATRPYGHLLGVLLNEPDDPARFSDARTLLDWGFSLEQQGITPPSP
ncbi:MAG TPA: D-alanyl-D-alanine carboxypeptidase family protein [Ktedonobacterales bacterium]